MYRRLFGVPDEITDMTRSLKMVETKRLVYWKVIFRHRKGSGGHRINTGVPGSYRNPPGGQWAFMGLSGNRGQQGSCGARPPRPKLNWFRSWGPAPSFLLPSSSFLPLLVGLGFAEGGREKGWPPPSPCPIRTKGGEGRAAHVGLPLLFSTKAHHGPFSSRGVPVTFPVFR